MSLSAPTSWQAQGNAPLLKKADRETAELRQKGEAVEGLEGGRQGGRGEKRGREEEEDRQVQTPLTDGSAELLCCRDTDLRKKLFWPQLLMKSYDLSSGSSFREPEL